MDIKDPERPVLISTTPFVSQQPTGMLVVGDALFGTRPLQTLAVTHTLPRANCQAIRLSVRPAVSVLTRLVAGSIAVAGEHDLMVFDMRSSARSPPLVATCGAACAAVGDASGQNFHSIAYKLLGGKHLVFISAQIDNNMGAVEVVGEDVVALLTPVGPRRHRT